MASAQALRRGATGLLGSGTTQLLQRLCSNSAASTSGATAAALHVAHPESLRDLAKRLGTEVFENVAARFRSRLPAGASGKLRVRIPHVCTILTSRRLLS